MKVMILGYWGPYVGTDYCEYLGEFESLDDAYPYAEEYAWERWEGPEDSEFEDEGPDYHLEEYDPKKHNMRKSGGGSFF